jgi:hypothetical protein
MIKRTTNAPTPIRDLTRLFGFFKPWINGKMIAEPIARKINPYPTYNKISIHIISII